MDNINEVVQLTNESTTAPQQYLCECAKCGAEKITWAGMICDNPLCFGLFEPSDVGVY